MRTLVIIGLLLLIVGISTVSANEIDTTNCTISEDTLIVPDDVLNQEKINDNSSKEVLKDSESDIIEVNNWNELQYYCSLKDKDYTLKLKDNTNFYPTKTGDSNYQIKVYNNVKIIGGNGSYIGDKSSNPSSISYTAIVVPDGYKSSIYLENITFKWISALGSPDGLFIQMGGKYNSVIKNCQFFNINVGHGHASIVYLKKGTATLENCSFINCTSGYGCVGIYDPDNVKKIKMIVRNCYFEGNYATTAPGCINNCGVLEVYNSTFYKNRAFWWAGAIHTHGGGNTTIHDSNFTDNVAGWNGGALYTYSYLQIYNTVFSGNNCTTNNGGGAIGACAYQSNPHIYIEKCLFEANANNCWGLDELSTTGTGRGGAISFMDEGSIEVHDTTFIANSASIGTAICAWAMSEYGSPNVIITNNSFINHTRDGDTLNVQVSGSIAVVEDNYFHGNSIKFSRLILTKVNEGKDQAILEVSSSLYNPSYYDLDILDKTKYEVYINNEYVKTVDSRVFTIDFDELDTCDVYVIPTISNQKSNSVHLVSTRDYIFVSKSNGDDTNNGLSRQTPVNTIKKSLELAGDCHSILIMDGEYGEGNLQIDYDLLIKGEGNATLTNSTSFIVHAENFTLKNMQIKNIAAETFIKQVDGNLIIDKCIFNNNLAEKLIDADNVNITKSIFTNNNLIIYNNGFTTIKNSILLNNTQVIDNNVDNIDLNYNWWGNTLNDVSKPTGLNINNWLVFNASSNKQSLEIGQNSLIHFACYLVDNDETIEYGDLINVNFQIITLNGITNKNSVSQGSNIIYTQNGCGDGIFTAKYNNILISIPFTFVKSDPNIAIKTNNIQYGQDLTVKIIAPEDINGTVTVFVGENSKTLQITGKQTTFTFNNLNADDYVVFANFSGNQKYLSQIKETRVTVNKYSSITRISMSPIAVGTDLNITISTTIRTTGNITFSINNFTKTLILKNYQASYVLKNLSRGDYLIKAIYNGNDKYASSYDSIFLEVDNLNPNLSVSIENTSYGEMAVIDVSLDGDAEGWVSATIDGIINSSEVINGRSKIYLKGAEAGINRNVTIFYSGDNTYFNRTITANMTVFKNNFTFNISSEDIFIGHDAVITIKVPLKTTGNFTINGVVLSIPMSGEVSYTFEDLEVGEYTVTAVYNGNNYFDVENSTSFKVFEYPSPQWTNDGVDTQNTQKTDYVSHSIGYVSWVDQVNSTIIANLVIDSEGNLYVATTNGIYSYDSEGNLRWIYVSDGRIGNFSGLAIGRDIIISPRAGDTIYLIRNVMDLINQTTGEKYGSSNIYQASSIYVPIIDSNAFIYTVGEYNFEGNGYNLVITPFKIWENGGQPIQVSLGKIKPIAAPSVNEDMVVVLGEGTLMIFDAHTLSANSMKNGNFKNVRPVIGDGNIVYTILGDSIIAYTIDGSQSGSKIPITGGSGDRLLIDNELNLLYATNSEGHLYSYNLFTREETLISDVSITSGILIDGNHNLYFASNNIFYSITPEGKVLWKSDLGSNITGTPVMNKDGIIYVTSKDNKLFALSDVTLDDPELEVTASDIVQGGDAVITIKINNQTTGNVSFTLNNVDYSFETSNGTIVCKIPNLKAGTYSVDVVYPGDLRFNSSTKTITFTVKAIASLTTQVSGSTVTFTLPADATGTLTVKVNGQTYTKTLTNRKATITLADGTYDAVVTYSGNSKYAGFTKTIKLTVKNPVQPVKTTKKASKIVAKKKTFKAKTKTKMYTVTLKSGKTPIKKVKLTIKIKKKTYKATTNTKGKATFKIKKLTKNGRYTATIKFTGNKNYKATTKKVKIVIK